MSLKHSTPESQGLSSGKLAELLRALDRDIRHLHSFTLIRRREILLDAYWAPYRRGEVHLLNSLSKSVNVLAVGLAVEQGLLKLCDKPADFFPEALPEEYDPRILDITVEDLLRMTANSVALSVDFNGVTSSWITHYFRYKPPAPVGTRFFYESGASFMLSAMVTRATGRTVESMVDEAVFRPLGITDYYWPLSPEGYTVGGWGLHLSAGDLAKLGVFFNQLGCWEGKQLVPRRWMEQCTKKQADIGAAEGDIRQGYGYQFWIGRDDIFMAMGAWGQNILCSPGRDMVCVFTAGCGSDDINRALELILDSLYTDPLPDSLPENPTAQKELAALAENLALPAAPGDRCGRNEAVLLNRTFRFPENARGLRSLLLERLDAETLSMTLDAGGGEKTFLAGWRRWTDTHVPYGYGDYPISRLQSLSYGWEGDELVIEHTVVNSCFNDTLRLRPLEGRVRLQINRNVSFGDVPPEITVLSER